jgi:hypothetical protein
MKKGPSAIISCVMLFIILTAGAVAAQPVNDVNNATEAVADRLEAEQVKEGDIIGFWPEENDFTGSIAVGLIDACKLVYKPGYLDSAELGGYYILGSAAGNFLGDESLALTRLSQITENPLDNIWRAAANDFYANVKNISTTEGYIAQYAGTDPSTTVFYLANHTVAAYYVDAKDRLIWREGLIDWLSQVDDDSSNFPVLGLGAATWALAKTGPLDNRLVDPFGTGLAYWSGIRLADLPALLLSHQVPVDGDGGDPNQGSFYWRFDHSNAGNESMAAGYAEDTIFGALGLAAAAKADPEPDLYDAIAAAREALLRGIDASGRVYEHLSQSGNVFYIYAGEMLQALSELAEVAEPQADADN